MVSSIRYWIIKILSRSRPSNRKRNYINSIGNSIVKCCKNVSIKTFIKPENFVLSNARRGSPSSSSSSGKASNASPSNKVPFCSWCSMSAIPFCIPWRYNIVFTKYSIGSVVSSSDYFTLHALQILMVRNVSQRSIYACLFGHLEGLLVAKEILATALPFLWRWKVLHHWNFQILAKLPCQAFQ